MLHLFKTHLFLTISRSITRHFVSSSDVPPLPPSHVSEDALREQHRQNQQRDAQREHALYDPIIFYCPQGHPYMTGDTPKGFSELMCAICEDAQKSRQDAQEKPNPYQQHIDYMRQKRTTQNLVNHKIDKAIMPNIETTILDLGSLTAQDIAALCQSDVARQETRSEIPAMEQMIVEDESWLNSTPVIPVDVFDKDATMAVPAIMKLRHAS